MQNKIIQFCIRKQRVLRRAELTTNFL